MRVFVCLLLSFAEIWDTEGQPNMYLSRPVRIEDFPYMASVFVNDQFVGAAVIISREFALGNMHYFFGAYSYDVHLRVGHANRDEGEKVEVKDFFQHEEFQFSADYDICLIQFLEKIKFGPKVGAINLSLLPPPAGLRGEVLSWGPVIAKGTSELHAVTMATMTSAQCQATATEAVTDRLTCIANPTVHLCEEDLGAPFVVDGKLMGQYVGGFPTCQPQNVLFSKISQYKDYLVLLVDMARHPKSYEPISHMSEEQIET
uniref:Peptidase S1 domain-containing protein n=1 Tax=Homalodisca liturata TaxID=320908 RepID=A0A1B6K469_9HEMI